MSSAQAQTLSGGGAVMVSWIASLCHDLFPVISYIGVVAGAFVALHGTYMIIKSWYLKR